MFWAGMIVGLFLGVFLGFLLLGVFSLDKQTDLDEREHLN